MHIRISEGPSREKMSGEKFWVKEDILIYMAWPCRSLQAETCIKTRTLFSNMYPRVKIHRAYHQTANGFFWTGLWALRLKGKPGLGFVVKLEQRQSRRHRPARAAVGAEFPEQLLGLSWVADPTVRYPPRLCRGAGTAVPREKRGTCWARSGRLGPEPQRARSACVGERDGADAPVLPEFAPSKPLRLRGSVLREALLELVDKLAITLGL